jgi:hypothetical protein
VAAVELFLPALVTVGAILLTLLAFLVLALPHLPRRVREGIASGAQRSNARVISLLGGFAEATAGLLVMAVLLSLILTLWRVLVGVLGLA